MSDANDTTLTSTSFAAWAARAEQDAGSDRWLWDRIIPARGVVLPSGAAFAGKTTIVAALAAAMQRGDRLAGLAVRPGRMLYLHLEHSAALTAGTFRAAARGLGVDDSCPNVAVLDAALLLRGQAEEVADQAEDDAANVVVIDSLRRSDLHVESRTEDTEQLRRALEVLAGRDRVVLALHHLVVDGTRSRGGSDFPAMVDSEVILSRRSEVLTLDARHHGLADHVLRARVRGHLDPSGERWERYVLDAVAPDADPAAAREREKLRAATWAALAVPRSGKELETLVRGAREKVRAERAAMVREGLLIETPGPRKARIYSRAVSTSPGTSPSSRQDIHVVTPPAPAAPPATAGGGQAPPATPPLYEGAGESRRGEPPPRSARSRRGPARPGGVGGGGVNSEKSGRGWGEERGEVTSPERRGEVESNDLAGHLAGTVP